MSINSKLTSFAQLELVLAQNETERDRIKGSMTQLERILKDRLNGNIKEFVRFGSFTRNTILPRKYDSQSDVDLMVIFNTTNGRKTPGTYRKNLHDVITGAYPNSISIKNFPAVKLELYHIMFDIVPAYTDESSLLGNRYYYIPVSNDSWTSTTPNDINGYLSTKNQSYGDNIVRNVIRLCKHWNAGANYPLESYLMEKQIVNSFFWHGDNLYEKFLSVLDNIAGSRPGVKQALEYIRQYKGGVLTTPNEQKQLEWLKRLLPGLN